MNNNRAFLLLEVVLAISVLSLGLVFVVRSINLCMKTARTSFNYSQAINLAYEKMFELELASQEDGIERYSSKGKFSDNKNFGWEYKIENLEDKNLAKLLLRINWKEGASNKGFYIETYTRVRYEEKISL